MREQGGSGWVRAVVAVGRRPSLWPSAIRQSRRLAGSSWWRRSPFLPVPDRAYLQFRLETQYGAPGTPPDPRDLVAYLGWCRALDRQRTGRR